jgi:hypothetical protein
MLIDLAVSKVSHEPLVPEVAIKDYYPYRQGYWQLTLTALFINGLILVLGIALTIYSWASHFVNGYTLSGWSISVAQFLFQALPTFVSHYLGNNLGQPADIFHRITPPFTSMGETPQPAEKNIFLSYPSDMPGKITYKAAKNAHWKVVWFSSVNQASGVFPVLTSGLFFLTRTSNGVFVSTSLATLSGIIAFLAINLITVVVAYPSTIRRLPRVIRSQVDTISLFYASKFLPDPILDLSARALTKEDFAERLKAAQGTFGPGIYDGVDGNRHVGFDSYERKNDEDGKVVENVEWIPPVRRRAFGKGKSTTDATMLDVIMDAA